MSKAPMIHVSTDILKEYVLGGKKTVNGMSHPLSKANSPIPTKTKPKLSRNFNGFSDHITNQSSLKHSSRSQSPHVQTSSEDTKNFGDKISKLLESEIDGSNANSKTDGHCDQDDQDSFLLDPVNESCILEESVLKDSDLLLDSSNKMKDPAADADDLKNLVDASSPRSEISLRLRLSSSSDEDDIDEIDEERLLKGTDVPEDEGAIRDSVDLKSKSPNDDNALSSVSEKVKVVESNQIRLPHSNGDSVTLNGTETSTEVGTVAPADSQKSLREETLKRVLPPSESLQNKSTKTDSIQPGSSSKLLDTSELAVKSLESPKTSTSIVETPKLTTNSFETPKLTPSSSETSKTATTSFEASKINNKSLETAKVTTTSVEKSKTMTKSLHTSTATTSLPPALTFSDAFAALAMERPAAIVPAGETLALENSSSSLTLLSSQPSKPVADTGDRAAKKRTLPTENTDSSSSTLKKFRLQKDKQTTFTNESSSQPSVTNPLEDTDLMAVSRQLVENTEMESWLRAEKTQKKSSAGDDLVVLDDQELMQRARDEMKKAQLTPRKIKKIRRKDLENIVIEMFVDKVLYEHELGQRKDLNKRLETTLETNRKKAAQFHKELADLKKVTNKLQEDYKMRKNQLVVPVKVRRSVGIQASPALISKGLIPVNSKPSSSVANQVRPVPGGTIIPDPNTPRTAPGPAPNPLQPLQRVALTLSQPLPPLSSYAHKKTSANQVRNNASCVTSTPMTSSIPVINSLPIVVQAPPLSQNNQVAKTVNPPNLLQAALQLPPSSQSSSSSGVIDLTDDIEVISPQVNSNVASLSRPALVSATSTAGPQLFAINGGTNAPVNQFLLVSTSIAQSSPTTLLVGGGRGVNSSAVAVRPSVSQAAPARPRAAPPSPLAPTLTTIVQSKVPAKTSPAWKSARGHPAPLPKAPPQQTIGFSKKLPPAPILKVTHKDKSIVLSWTMSRTNEHENIASYQLYAYQEGSAPPSAQLWKKVGSVKALELPMACTLTQFMPGHIYHFAVRAVDIRTRLGPFSPPKSILLEKR